jgi:hypothetical protein
LQLADSAGDGASNARADQAVLADPLAVGDAGALFDDRVAALQCEIGLRERLDIPFADAPATGLFLHMLARH